MASTTPIIRPYLRGSPPSDTASHDRFVDEELRRIQYSISDATNFAAGGEYASGGRLTAVSGSPFYQGNGTGFTTCYFTPAVHDIVPIWNGANFIPQQFVELSDSLSDTTNSPAACVASSLYDYFVSMRNGVMVLSRGPVWTTTGWGTSARGTGAGTTQLTQVNGVYVNAYAIANGPPAGYGTYVGTMLTNATGAQFNFNPEFQSGSGGAANVYIGLWNMYNRRPIYCYNYDNGTGYTYATATWRGMRASGNLNIRYVNGLGIEGFTASAGLQVTTAAAIGASTAFGVGHNSATGNWPYAKSVAMSANAYLLVGEATVHLPASLGAGYIAGCEFGDGVNTNTLSQGYIGGQFFQ